MRLCGYVPSWTPPHHMYGMYVHREGAIKGGIQGYDTSATQALALAFLAHGVAALCPVGLTY
jgi:hypothetical protein